MGKVASSFLSLPLILVLFTAQPVPALSQGSLQQQSRGSSLLDQIRQQTNENVTTIISGNPNGSYLRIAYDIAAVVDEGDKLRVLPIVGMGAVQNIRDTLFLKGVDMGLANTVSLSQFRKNDEFGRHVSRQIVYITRLFEDEFHLLVRPEINSLKDLEGKEVNYSDAGSGAQLSAQLMFKGFGISPKEVNMGQADAIELMKKGQVFGTLCTCLKPLAPYKAVPKELGFKLLHIPLEGPMVEDYVPTTFTHEDYPNLVPEGSRVETVAIPTALIAYNWPTDHERYRRIAKFTESFFSKLKDFHKPPRHPRWKNVNLSAELKGWVRLKAAQEWLDNVAPAQSGGGIDTVLARAQAARVAPSSPAEQERLFRQFLEWSKRNGR
jgi:TRAP-type uncharacterized transport system substrate-binding protein